MSNKTFFWYQRQVMSSGIDTEFINIIKCHGYGERENLSRQDEATKIRSALKIREHSKGCFNWRGQGPVTESSLPGPQTQCAPLQQPGLWARPLFLCRQPAPQSLSRWSFPLGSSSLADSMLKGSCVCVG